MELCGLTSPEVGIKTFPHESGTQAISLQRISMQNLTMLATVVSQKCSRET